MAISDFVANKWYILAVVIVLAIIFGKMIVKIPAVRMLIDRIKVMANGASLPRSSIQEDLHVP